MQSPLAVVSLKNIAAARMGWDDEGQDLLEYALLVALIALVATVSVTQVGQVIFTLFWDNIATEMASL